MKITIQKKTLGRSRKLAAIEYELPKEPNDLRQMLQMLVKIEIGRYSQADTMLQFLTKEQEKSLDDLGSVKFTSVISHEELSLEKSIKIMEQAYEDGLFKVIQDKHVYDSLDEKIHSTANNWTFIKLTFLAGN